jgi:hypothetical protein
MYAKNGISVMGRDSYIQNTMPNFMYYKELIKQKIEVVVFDLNK